jgi:osmotically-inducible protein OsmY
LVEVSLEFDGSEGGMRMSSRDYRDEDRFRPASGSSESWRQRGGRTGGSYGDGYRYQGAEVGTYGNPGGGYGEYNWERGGDFGRGGREEYNRWGDEVGRGREVRYGQDYARGVEQGRGDFGRRDYGREGEWEREPGRDYGRDYGSREYGGVGGGEGQDLERTWGGPRWGSSMSSEGYRQGGAHGRQQTGSSQSASRYGGAGTISGYGSQGYRSEPYGSQGQRGSEYGWGSESTRSHYGKGPMGYTRSDERLREEVSDRLTEDHEVDASRLNVRVKDGEVTLEGAVDDRRMKRKAEDVAEGVMGVKQVHNQLRVEKPDGGAQGAAAREGTSREASTTTGSRR